MTREEKIKKARAKYAAALELAEKEHRDRTAPSWAKYKADCDKARTECETTCLTATDDEEGT